MTRIGWTSETDEIAEVAYGNVLISLCSCVNACVQIMPHLGAAPNSKDRVVLYLKAKNPADKEAWMADYTAHALYAMHVKMRQLVSPISEES